MTMGGTVLKRFERVALSTLMDPARTSVDLGETILVEVPLLGAPSLAPREIDVPEAVGSYRIVRKIGEGGRGTVYEATHTGLETTWALKVLKLVASGNALCVAEIQHEARVTAKLKQRGVEGIVVVPHVDQMPDGRWYMVVEFLTGRTLQAEIFEGADRFAKAHGIPVSQNSEYPPEAYQLSVERATGIARQVAEIMEAVHREGVVHRDLKPANVFIGRSGKSEAVRVVDFGLAVDLRSSKPDWVPAGTPVGSPPYMPPEQVRGSAVDARSDVYAAGAMLYECLVGRYPHEGAGDMRRAKCEVAPPLVSESRSDVPSGVVTLVRDALAIDPNHRPQSMAEFKDRLRAATMVRVTGEHTQRAATPGRSRSVFGTLMGILVLAGVLAGGLLGWRTVDPASFAEFMVVVHKVTSVVREASGPFVDRIREELRGEESAPTPASKVEVAPKPKAKASPRQKPAKRQRAKSKAVTAARDASALPETPKP